MAIKQRPDSPTNNFATMNVLDISHPTQISLSDGNLKVNAIGSYTGYIKPAPANIVIKDGTKCYIEFYINFPPTNNVASIAIGVVNPDFDRTAHFDANGSILLYNWNSDGNASKHSLNTNNSYGSAVDGRWLHQSIGAVFVDLESANKTISWYSSNGGSWTQIDSATIPANIESDCLFVIYTEKSSTSSGDDFIYVNFGQDPTFGGASSLPTAPSGSPFTDANGIGAFYYDPTAIDPEALALCTANLPKMTPTVDDDVPKDYFKAVKWIGSTNGGVYNNGVVTTGMAADLVWFKDRLFAHDHQIYDSVRGEGKAIRPNIVNEEVDWVANPQNTTGIGLSDFTDTSFTVPTTGAADGGSGGMFGLNRSGSNMVAWCWKAGGAPTANNSNTSSGPMTADSVSLNGTLQSNYTPAGSPTIYPTRMSINTDAGFSIVKYGGSNTTGLLSSSVSSATIPHGLNDCEFCIIKNIRWSNTWVVSHRSIAPNVMSLQDTGQAASTPSVDPTYGQITTLGSNTVTITRGTSRGDNVGEDRAETNGQFEYIAYCWHSVEGFSKFGSYTGNGSTDGPFVYCGFRPAWVMVKRTDGTGSWVIHDSARDPYNEVEGVLNADAATQETTYSTTGVDFLSNGFKLRGDSSWYGNNSSTQTAVFMAFAEQPFNYANAR